ncbi:MAG: hypothetical protein WCT14_14460 [Treponemataceae bacterium]
MDKIRIISTPQALRAYIDELHSRGVDSLAFDLEADQGSYRYRYSVSIFQCFDGNDAVVVDALALAASGDCLRELLEAPDIVKVMFSSKNDLFITQNVLGFGISPIRDIAVAQKILGLQVNLSAHLGIEKAAKDTFQRANWLKRPISPDLLAYAVGDVELLLKIEADLRAVLAERKLLDRYKETCAALPRSDYRVDQYRQYENKFPGYPRLGPEKKELARLLWIFRELVGEYFDTPVGYIISTKALPDLIQKGPEALAARLIFELNKGRRTGRRIELVFVEDILSKARGVISAGLSAPGFRP